MNQTLTDLLKITQSRNASDLHLIAGRPASVRITGDITALENYKILTPPEIEEMVRSILTIGQVERLFKDKSVDIAIGLENECRFRLNVYFQRGSMVAVFRKLNTYIPSLKELNLPSSLERLTNLKDGLVLITGPTGSGKSTTLATLINEINQKHNYNIITVEDPIEYMHKHGKSIVSQRELGLDVNNFADALYSALRADPDVILVGEMRDINTIRTALLAAETGHLVFSTLHTRDAAGTINRIVGAFPEGEQPYIQQQLSLALKCVVAQRLMPSLKKTELIPITEVMYVNSAISNLVRHGKIDQVRSILETSSEDGMHTAEQCLASLIKQNKIDMETAMRFTSRPKDLTSRLESFLVNHKF